MPFRPDRLKALREAKNLSQEQLAELAGLSHSLIAKSESGKNSPRSDALDKLSRALDCTIDYLHGRGYEKHLPAVAAAQMAFDVFVTEGVSDEVCEKCRRIITHPDAPKTARAWRSFAEMLGLAIGPTSSTNALSLVGDRAKRKPVAAARQRQN